MRKTFGAVKIIIGVIAVLVFLSGIILTLIGIYDFVIVFAHLGPSEQENIGRLMAIGLLHSVDMFLVAIVFFVLAIGMLILFTNPEANMPKLPAWLHVKNFMELKAILWEAILTTLVVAYLAKLVEGEIEGKQMAVEDLLIPGGVLLIAMSLFFLKRAEK
jgi:uncharacterized membrane protein YqhA